MSIPSAFSDIAKAANDLLGKDFYHTSAGSLEVKSKAPNGVSFNVKGKSSHEGSTSGTIEAKYKDEASGIYFHNLSMSIRSPPRPRKHPRQLSNLDLAINVRTTNGSLLIRYDRPGMLLTQGWTTANALDTKIEFEDVIAKGLKPELLTSYNPASKKYSAKVNMHFKQANFHGRAFFDLIKGPTATVDAVMGHEGFMVGAEAGYDVQKAAITRYSAALAYTAPEYAAAVTASDNLSIFTASYYHKVNPLVEAGAKAVWDSKIGNNVAMEVATKYRVDPGSFVKAKLNDRGIGHIAYNVMLRPGFVLGLGASLDTQKLNEASHKVGASFTFEG